MTTKSPDPGETGSVCAAGEVAGEIRLALPTFVQYVNTSPMTSNRKDFSSSRKRTARWQTSTGSVTRNKQHNLDLRGLEVWVV
jgi:hypothetical protein